MAAESDGILCGEDGVPLTYKALGPDSVPLAFAKVWPDDMSDRDAEFHVGEIEWGRARPGVWYPHLPWWARQFHWPGLRGRVPLGRCGGDEHRGDPCTRCGAAK